MSYYDDKTVGLHSVAECRPNRLDEVDVERLGLVYCWEISFKGVSTSPYAGGRLATDPSRGTLYASPTPAVFDERAGIHEEFVLEPGSGRVVIYHATADAICFTTNTGARALNLNSFELVAATDVECPEPSPVGVPVKGSCRQVPVSDNTDKWQSCWVMTLPNRERMHFAVDAGPGVDEWRLVICCENFRSLGPLEIPGVGTVDYTHVRGRPVTTEQGAPPGVSGRPSIYHVDPLFLCFTTPGGAAAYVFHDAGPDGNPGRFAALGEVQGCPDAPS